MPADPADPPSGRIRAARPGTLIADPVLQELSAARIGVKSARLPSAGRRVRSDRALGRPFLAGPDPVRRLALGAPPNPVRDRYLMYTGGATGCTDRPALDDQPSSASMVALDGPRLV
ncbi:hypothetical protein [Streptomyces sp. bgisy034]|uniref:hypothetical protein n=1 Tax=Streptomyces sp. bgisy034 TaxID=3413774 RepID=UPI003EBDF71C